MSPLSVLYVRVYTVHDRAESEHDRERRQREHDTARRGHIVRAVHRYRFIEPEVERLGIVSSVRERENGSRDREYLRHFDDEYRR